MNPGSRNMPMAIQSSFKASKISGDSKFTRFANNSANTASNTPLPGQIASEDGVMEDHNSLTVKIDLLEKDLERRQESYIIRERAYKLRIEELEGELEMQRQGKIGWMESDQKMATLKAMQGQILKNVDIVQDRTTKILQEQERDLLRAFRARLFDVQSELEKEKSKKDNGVGAWIERSRKLEAEVEWAKEVADRLERLNQSLKQDNDRLKSQFSSQEEDRNYLVKQLMAAKKENTRLKAEYTALEAENENMKDKLRVESSGPQGLQTNPIGSGAFGAMKLGHNHAGAVGGNNSEAEDRLKDINARLRRLLAEERRSLQTVRQNYAAEIKARTDMELLLRKCVDDVRKEIVRRNLESGKYAAGAGANVVQLFSKASGNASSPGNNLGGGANISVEDFTTDDRQRTLELLLAQERVINLLYSKTFPGAGVVSAPASNNTGGALVDSPGDQHVRISSPPAGRAEMGSHTDASMLHGGGGAEFAAA